MFTCIKIICPLSLGVVSLDFKKPVRKFVPVVDTLSLMKNSWQIETLQHVPSQSDLLFFLNISKNQNRHHILIHYYDYYIEKYLHPHYNSFKITEHVKQKI